MYEKMKPKFVKHFAHVGEAMKAGFKAYNDEVKKDESRNNDDWMDMHATTLAQGIGCIGQMIDAINTGSFKSAEYYARYWVDKYQLTDLVKNIPDANTFSPRLNVALMKKTTEMVDFALSGFYDILHGMEEIVRSLNKNAPNNIYTMRILKMITDFVISTGCDTIATSTQKSYGKSIYKLLKNNLEKKYSINP